MTAAVHEPSPSVATTQPPGLVGAVHSWDLSTGTDGPGTRLVVFLAGCPLRCLYCQNPDTWHRHDGTPTQLAEMERLLDRYARFLRLAGGGLTVSGGEPLLQAPFTSALFAAARERGLSTALDTSGALGDRVGDELLDRTDLVLLDIKAYRPQVYRHLTGGSLAPTLALAERLAARGTRVWLRYVLVPGITDDVSDVAGLAELAASYGNIERVDVLPYHQLGREKYVAAGLPYPLDGTPTPSRALVERVREQFRAAGLRAP